MFKNDYSQDLKWIKNKTEKMDNFEEASIEEVNLLGQPDPSEVIQPDLAAEGSSVASLQLSDNVTVPNIQYAESEPPLPEKDLETDTKAKPEIHSLPDAKSDCPPVFVPDANQSEMDSVSLSDGEDNVDTNTDEKSNKNVITNGESNTNAENENSDYLLERIRELKEERDRVCFMCFR